MYFDKNCHDYSKLEIICQEVDDIVYTQPFLPDVSLTFSLVQA